MIENETQLEELLSRPDERVVELFARLKGPLAILGAGGKIGPSLARMACRARDQAGSKQEVFVVSRFSNAAAKAELESCGARAISADLMDEAAVAALPDAAHVIYMIGQKFGTQSNPSLTWAVNALIPAYASRRYRHAGIVAYSTGCVYDFAPVASAGSREGDPLTPIGEYSNACVARERIFEHFSALNQTPMVMVRLCYAVDLRYGVLVDLATDIQAGREINVGMGYFNVIWQGDANRMTLRMLDHVAVPAKPMNLTGPAKLSLRETALTMGRLMGKPVRIAGQEAPTALLNDASRTFEIMGRPEVSEAQLIEWTANWIACGGKTLNKPTHFQTRDGKY